GGIEENAAVEKRHLRANLVVVEKVRIDDARGFDRYAVPIDETVEVAVAQGHTGAGARLSEAEALRPGGIEQRVRRGFVAEIGLEVGLTFAACQTHRHACADRNAAPQSSFLQDDRALVVVEESSTDGRRQGI